jgi:hypothetical protein
MEDLAELADLVTGFAAREHLTIVPAVPQHDYGPEVCLGPTVLDLPRFLNLARQLGGGVLYLHATPFDPAAVDGDQPEDPPSHLLRHKGQPGQISVAFAANGLVHFWEHHTAWFAEWEELASATVTRPEMDEEDGTERLSPEERARLVTELAEAILADPQFRGVPRGEKLRTARRLIPEGTSKWVGWDAAREACERVNQTAQERYDQLEDRLDDLAAELLATPAYQRASSPAARKQAAERFLAPHADGFFPPATTRDELYARAQKLAKAARAPASGLF